MCGIAGIFDLLHQPSINELEPMLAIIRHRGPDGKGALVDGPLAMGMQRLSIIDLTTGDQPIYNEDRSLAVVYNGEIYNYVELRDELLRHGHVFRTTGDTEVLAHGYEQWGTGLLARLNGMFAFAIWDRPRRQLFLARDRMGVKPLYYGCRGSRFAFGSEMKALLRQPELDGQLNPAALVDYLRLGYIPRGTTAVRSVQRLLPGHFLVTNGEQTSVHAWWRLDQMPLTSAWSERGYPAGDLVDAFDDAVRLRMRSDVPVGAFLSGGLDSSLIAVTGNRLSSQPLQTYTVGFGQGEFDETPYAAAVASQEHTQHHELSADLEDALQQLPRLVWQLDEPIADSAIVPSFLISRFAASRVKVCLSGLGGDELFGGYPRYGRSPAGRIRRLFRGRARLAGAMAPAMEPYHAGWAEELRLAADPGLAWRSYLHDLEVFDAATLRRIGLSGSNGVDELIESLWQAYPGEDEVGRLQFIDQHTYLPDQILALTDRMSMAVSLEVRVPFLDYHLIQLAAQLPGSLKQRSREFKIYLKAALGSRVPAQLLTRPKWGFASPVSRWLRMDAIKPVLQQLPDSLADVVDPSYLRGLIRDPRKLHRYAGRVWALLVLQVWRQVYRLADPPDAPLVELVGDA